MTRERASVASQRRDGGPSGRPNLHTTEEAAQILRVRKSWLERQAAGRRIPFTMLGGSYRFTDDHLADIVRIHEHLPVADTTPESAPAPQRARRPRTRLEVPPKGVMPLRPRPHAAKGA